MTFFILCLLSVYGLGGIIFAIALVTAPHGSQDEKGFHFESETDSVPEPEGACEAVVALAHASGLRPAYVAK